MGRSLHVNTVLRPVFSLKHLGLDIYRIVTMKKGNSNSDKASHNISEDEEVSQETPEIHSLNEQSEKNVNLLDILKNFFTNHAQGKSSTSALNENKKKVVKSENENIKNYKNAPKQLLIKNGGNVDNSSGGEFKENGSGQTNQRDANQRLTCKNHELEPNRNNARVIPKNGSLQENHSVTAPSEFANRTYENLRPPALQRLQQGISETAPSSKPLSQKEHENANPETRIRNNREGAISERLANERQGQQPFVRASATSPNVQHRRNSSTGLSGDARRPPFRIMRFIQNNVRRMSLPNIHSGGVVLLNNVEGTNVKFTELRGDMDPIRTDTLTHERICNARLMSGGSVVFEEFSDAFVIPDFYQKDLILDALANDLKCPETIPKFEVFQQTTSPRPVMARSHSGGGITEVDISGKTALPELFPTKKTPPKSSPLNRLHSGGGVVEADDFQNQIYVDLLSQSIRFDVGQSKRSPASDDKRDRQTS